MRQIHFTRRDQWRNWLSKNHDRQPDGIWLVFYRKCTAKPTLDYEAAVEEALCFGWIDSTLRKIDEERYCRKFTPRKNTSRWSATNRRRAEKVLKEDRMTEFGLAKIEAARRAGTWEPTSRSWLDQGIPRELAEALARDQRAKECFDKLAPSYQRQYVGWIVTAKRPETRAKRLHESLFLLAQGKKLGLK